MPLTAALLLVGCSDHLLEAGGADAPVGPAEVCNGVDDDGDGAVDEGFRDADSDGIADCAVCELEPAPGVVRESDRTCLGVDPVATDAWDVEVRQRILVEYDSRDSGRTRARVSGSVALARLAEAGPVRLLTGFSGGTTTSIDQLVAADPLTGTTDVLWRGEVGESVADLHALAAARIGPASVVTRLTRWADPYSVSSGPQVLDASGTILWERDIDDVQVFGAPRLAQLDDDGVPELIFLAHLWRMEGTGTALEGGTNGMAEVGDGDLDGVPEIADAGNVYAPDGSPLRIRDPALGAEIGNHCTETLFVQADDDAEAETLVSGPFLLLLDDDGAEVWRDELGDDRYSAGFPTVADFDGDGRSEVAVVGWGAISMFDLDGTLRWEATVPRLESGGGAAGWDVDGDGASELLVLTSEGWFAILDGATGASLAGLPTDRPRVLQPFLQPVPVDLDGDGHGEILLPVAAWDEDDAGDESASWSILGPRVGPGWAPAGPNWPGMGFQVTNIDPAGNVAGPEVHPWLDWGVWNARPAADAGGADLLPALGGSCVDACTEVGTVRLTARVDNVGRRPAASVTLSLVAVDAAGTRTVDVRDVATSLAAGEGSAEVLFEVAAADILGSELRLVADPDGTVVECDEQNNELRVENPCG